MGLAEGGEGRVVLAGVEVAKWHLLVVELGSTFAADVAQEEACVGTGP